jgi:hypothetical protein
MAQLIKTNVTNVLKMAAAIKRVVSGSSGKRSNSQAMKLPIVISELMTPRIV